MGCGTSKPPVVSTAHQTRAPLPSKPHDGKPGQHRSIQQDSRKPENPRIEQNETENQHEYIDSSEFHPLSYEEVAALRPSDPENMWAIVKKTCDRNREWRLDSVKNRRGWKTIRLFVSSTFRDFHAEREALVKEVGCIIHDRIQSIENNLSAELKTVLTKKSRSRRKKEVLSWLLTAFDFRVLHSSCKM